MSLGRGAVTDSPSGRVRAMIRPKTAKKRRDYKQEAASISVMAALVRRCGDSVTVTNDEMHSASERGLEVMIEGESVTLRIPPAKVSRIILPK